MKQTKTQRTNVLLIARIRNNSGMTVREIANEIGVTERTMYRYMETGRIFEPVRKLLIALAEKHPTGPAPGRPTATMTAAAAA